MKTVKNSSRGFTLIEILMVMAIASILFGIGIVYYNSFKERSDISIWANKTIGVISSAKQKTVQSEKELNYGIHLDNDKFTLFEGEAYDVASSSNEIYNLPASLEIASISLVLATSNIIFERLTGNIQNYGQFILRAQNDNSNFIVLHVDQSGNSGIGQWATYSAQGMASDSRHLHFTFNQNIQSATELYLEFPDYPASNTSIPFQNYLDGGKAEFYWEDTIIVNGIEQKLKIHTHNIGLTSAIFSVHRDRRYNNTRLNIKIDNGSGRETLVSYQADGQESESSVYIPILERQ